MRSIAIWQPPCVSLPPVRECYTGSTAAKYISFAARRKSPLCMAPLRACGAPTENAIIHSDLPAQDRAQEAPKQGAPEAEPRRDQGGDDKRGRTRAAGTTSGLQQEHRDLTSRLRRCRFAGRRHHPGSAPEEAQAAIARSHHLHRRPADPGYHRVNSSFSPRAGEVGMRGVSAGCSIADCLRHLPAIPCAQNRGEVRPLPTLARPSRTRGDGVSALAPYIAASARASTARARRAGPSNATPADAPTARVEGPSAPALRDHRFESGGLVAAAASDRFHNSTRTRHRRCARRIRSAHVAHECPSYRLEHRVARGVAMAVIDGLNSSRSR